MAFYDQILIGVVILLHLYFLWLEMFAWTTHAPKIFRGYPREFFEQSTTLAANQGLYNGFLAAGLTWSLLVNESPWNIYVAIFFLSCVVIAGIYGSLTADRKIFIVQGLPALVALVVLHF